MSCALRKDTGSNMVCIYLLIKKIAVIIILTVEIKFVMFLMKPDDFTFATLGRTIITSFGFT